MSGSRGLRKKTKGKERKRKRESDRFKGSVLVDAGGGRKRKAPCWNAPGEVEKKGEKSVLGSCCASARRAEERKSVAI